MEDEQNKTKQNKTKQNKTKQNKTKQNKTKQNKTKQMLALLNETNAEIVMDYCDDADGYYFLGLQYESINNSAKSVDYYIKAIVASDDQQHHHHLNAYKKLCQNCNDDDDEKVAKIRFTWLVKYVEILEQTNCDSVESDRVYKLMGDIYSYGYFGVEVNYKLAISYYEKCDPMNSVALNSIGYCWGELENSEKSISWFLKSAALNNCTAKYNLYISYHLSRFYNEYRDFDKSFYWACQYLESSDLTKLPEDEINNFAKIYLTGKIGKFTVCAENRKYAALLYSKNNILKKKLLHQDWWTNELILSDDSFAILSNVALTEDSLDWHILTLIQEKHTNYLTDVLFRLMGELSSVELIYRTSCVESVGSDGMSRLKRIITNYFDAILTFILSDFLDLARCPREVGMVVGEYLPWFEQMELSYRQRSKKRTNSHFET